jgi:N-acetylglutamate synthase-like GNAT family acetyltransferase
MMVDQLVGDSIAGTDEGLREALIAAQLPTEDLSEPGRQFFRFSAGGRIIGYGGIELHGSGALLRSLVVLPPHRASGLGKALARRLLDQAEKAGADRAYVLTSSASQFFASIGFQRLERSAAPAEILATRQAAALCPATAALLMRPLGQGLRHEEGRECGVET